jgi:DNA-directed RNA polymerase specialized sigma24 family protein
MKAEFSTNQVSLADYPNDLIEGCRKGDHKSQLQIYKLYYRQVYATCLKLSDNPAIAENLMHESFLDAFENIGSYSGDTGFGSWILKFLKNNS